jgi:adenosylmethionine---8-amino-7-oxononanoate aminotransferase
MNPQSKNAALAARSLASVWHPCTQMKHHESLPMIPIVSGSGVWLVDADGNRYLDAVSSWWVNLFGHANPRINTALKNQLDTLEHVMLAGFTHEPAIELAERLGKLAGLGHAFYASDGASAVEIALKMSFHFWRNSGKPAKQKFVSLKGSYHGETLGALAVTDVAIFRDAYGPLLNNNLIVDFPSDTARPRKGVSIEKPISTGVFRHDAPPPKGGLHRNAASSLPLAACCPECVVDAGLQLEQLFKTRATEIAAFIIEPLVQGANGMRTYHADYLKKARELCTKYEVHFIADEIMTGFGRTGSMFACEQVNVRPDLMCLSKGITGGYLPLSCVLSTDQIYAAFYADDTARGFLHSHSYTGSALACRAALATLDIFASDNVIESNRAKATRFTALAQPLAVHSHVKNFRQLGMIWAFEVDSNKPDFARQFFAASLQRGILLRPIGNTVYFMPPYIIEEKEFQHLVTQTLAIIDELCR